MKSAAGNLKSKARKIPTRRCPIEYWQNATVDKYYRPLKTPVSVRIDNDVLAWLKSQGEGHLTRINEILRERMLAETRRHR